jgi:hypothetical protein
MVELLVAGSERNDEDHVGGKRQWGVELITMAGRTPPCSGPSGEPKSTHHTCHGASCACGFTLVPGVLVAGRGQAVAGGVVGQLGLGPVVGPFVRVGSQLLVPVRAMAWAGGDDRVLRSSPAAPTVSAAAVKSAGNRPQVAQRLVTLSAR